MEYLEFQGGLDWVDDDGEGIALRLVPEMNDAIGKDNPVYRIYIDHPDDAEETETGSLSLASSDLELTSDGSRGQQIVGIRLTAVDGLRPAHTKPRGCRSGSCRSTGLGLG